MAVPTVLAAALMAAQMGKSMFVDAPAEARQRKLAAKTALYSPWTGMEAQLPKPTDYVGPALSGAAQGYALGQNMEDYELNQKIKGEYLKNLEAGRTSSPQVLLEANSFRMPEMSYQRPAPTWTLYGQG